MARGPSGRIVVEIDPRLKRELHAELIRQGQTLKSWFTQEAQRYLRDASQPRLFVAEREPNYLAHPSEDSDL